MDWVFVVLTSFIASIFLWDGMRRWWRQNEWKRRLRNER